MRRQAVIVSMVALLALVSVGCSSRSKSGYTPPPALSSSAVPAGGERENGELPFSVELTATWSNAIIYYEAGADPSDPTTDSPVYEGTPLAIDAGYAGGTFIVRFFATSKRGTVVEEPFNTEVYTFIPDAYPPQIFIYPPGNTSFAYQSDADITLTASDTVDSPVEITIYYTVTYDGSVPEDPRTSAKRQTGMGNGTHVTWASGDTCRVKAYAVDRAGRQSRVIGAEYGIDLALIPLRVRELVNEDRALLGLPGLLFNDAWAWGCEQHSLLIYSAEQKTTVVKPSGHEDEGYIPFWYDSEDLRTLIDWPFDDVEGFVIDVPWIDVELCGYHAADANEFFFKLKANADIWDLLMDPATSQIGVGFFDNVWEIIIED